MSLLLEVDSQWINTGKFERSYKRRWPVCRKSNGEFIAVSKSKDHTLVLFEPSEKQSGMHAEIFHRGDLPEFWR